MRVSICLVVLLVAVASCDDDKDWDNFKGKNRKHYKNKEEEHKRKKIFIENKNFVKKHQAQYDSGEVTFNVTINKYADMTPQEFVAKMNGFRVTKGHKRTGKPYKGDTVERPGDSVDWRLKGAVTAVKDQGSCGSCYAFSAVGSLEGQHFLKKGQLVDLSEQNVVDCSRSVGNYGCNGGLMNDAFEYIDNNNGVDTEDSYPYEGLDTVSCRYNVAAKGAESSGFVDIPSGDERSLQQAVANVGPISVAIDASNPSFQLYSSGVYNEPKCSSSNLDHGVLLVGYGSSAKKGGDYWLVKNSWGTGWGMEGYIKMARNKNNLCGIATMASYPIVL